MDGKHYDADLLASVPETVLCVVPKESCEKGVLKSSELTTKAEAAMLEEHSGLATGDSNSCCGTT